MSSFLNTLFDIFWQKRNIIAQAKIGMRQWYPDTIFSLKTHDPVQNFAVVVLNRPIRVDTHFAINLWNKASIRTLVDGGANHWLRFKEKTIAKLANPDLLTGDFDSVTQATVQCIRDMGATIQHTNDQDETDFTKSLMELKKNYVDTENIGSIVVLLDTSGRIDHLLSHINTLFKAHVFLPTIDIFILAKDSMSWLLGAGQHTIHVPPYLVERQIWCSYVPIGHECSVTTRGLKWDLEKRVVKFGGMVSTSNTYKTNVLTIETDGFLYWSMGLEDND